MWPVSLYRLAIIIFPTILCFKLHRRKISKIRMNTCVVIVFNIVFHWFLKVVYTPVLVPIEFFFFDNWKERFRYRVIVRSSWSWQRLLHPVLFQQIDKWIRNILPALIRVKYQTILWFSVFNLFFSGRLDMYPDNWTISNIWSAFVECNCSLWCSSGVKCTLTVFFVWYSRIHR